MGKFTAALVVEDKYHITLCFCDTNSRAGKVSTWHGWDKAKVIAVEYWKKPRVTVLLVESALVTQRHEYYVKHGYTYDHDFVPHVTVAHRNELDKWKGMVGKEVSITGEYIRIF